MRLVRASNRRPFDKALVYNLFEGRAVPGLDRGDDIEAVVGALDPRTRELLKEDKGVALNLAQDVKGQTVALEGLVQPVLAYVDELVAVGL